MSTVYVRNVELGGIDTIATFSKDWKELYMECIDHEGESNAFFLFEDVDELSEYIEFLNSIVDEIKKIKDDNKS